MAKKQTFSDKTNQDNVNKANKRIKLIRSSISKTTGSIRFSEDMLEVTEGKSPESVIKEFLASK